MANPALEEAFDASVTVVRHLFTSPDSDFAVVLATAPDGDTVTAAGPLAHLDAGTKARIAGTWQDHPKYGPQVQASLGYELDPDDADGTRKYLLTIRGVGKTRAAALIERHGDDLFEAVDRDPEAAFGALPGMGAKGATRAADSWRERRALRELYLLLAPHGAGWLASQLHETHGPGAAGVVRGQPYLLTEEHGVGFTTADTIARANGIDADSPHRRRAAVVHLLREAERRGDTFLAEAALRGRARRSWSATSRSRCWPAWTATARSCARTAPSRWRRCSPWRSAPRGGCAPWPRPSPSWSRPAPAATPSSASSSATRWRRRSAARCRWSPAGRAPARPRWCGPSWSGPRRRRPRWRCARRRGARRGGWRRPPATTR